MSACFGLVSCGDDDSNPDADVVDYVEPPDDGEVTDDAAEAETTPMGPVVLYQSSAGDIGDGGSYYIPMNNGTSTVVVYSEQLDLFTIRNDGDAAVTLNSLTVTPGTGVMPEEFDLREADLVHSPLSLADEALAPDGTRDFYLRLFPVETSERTATLVLTYDTTHTLTVHVRGHGGSGGTQQALFSPDASATWHKVWGTAANDETVAGMTADAAGNAYTVGSTTQLVDTFAYDLLVSRIGADGSLAWQKIWYSNWTAGHRDWVPYTGDGDPGATDSIDEDGGFVYIAGQTCDGTNSADSAYALVMKVQQSDGALIWDRIFAANAAHNQANDGATGYAVDVAGDLVYVAGTTGADTSGSESHVMLLALQKGDATPLFDVAIDLAAGTNDRGYSVRGDGAGNVFVAGYTNNRGFLLKLTGATTATPTVAWAKQADLGLGSAFVSMALDAAGDVYLACDRRGADTMFSVAKFSGATGALTWAKTYDDPDASSGRNNAHVVRVLGGALYVGGRIAFGDFDAQMGDGLILKVAAADGTLDWSSWFFGGKGAEEMATHFVKGFALSGADLLVAGQVYTSNHNGAWYRGYWYDGIGEWTDYAPTVTDITTANLFDMANGSFQDAASHRTWEDPPAALVLQDAVAKDDGVMPDEDLFLMRLDVP